MRQTKQPPPVILERHVMVTLASKRSTLLEPLNILRWLEKALAPWIQDLAWYYSSTGEVNDVLYFHLKGQTSAHHCTIESLAGDLTTRERLQVGVETFLQLDPEGGAEIEDPQEVFSNFPQLDKVFVGNSEFLNLFLATQGHAPSISSSAFDELLQECRQQDSQQQCDTTIGLAYSDPMEYTRIYKVENDLAAKVNFSFCRGLKKQLQSIQLMNRDPRISAYRIQNDVYLLLEWNPGSRVVNEAGYETQIQRFIESKAEPLCSEADIKLEFLYMSKRDLALKLEHTPAHLCTLIYPNDALEGCSDSESDSDSKRRMQYPAISKRNRLKAGFIVQPHLTRENCTALEQAIKAKSDNKIERLNVYNSADGSTQLLCFYADPYRGGFNRYYFTDNAGSTILKQFGLQVTRFNFYKNSEVEFFRQYEVTETFYGDNEPLTEYFNRLEGEEKIKGSKEETTLINSLILEYQGFLLKGENVTVESFRLKHQNNVNKLRTLVSQEKVFNTIYNDSLKQKWVSIARVEPIEKVKAYCKNNPLQKGERRLTAKFLANVELFDTVDAIFKCIVVKENLKRGGVLLYGPPNTGKSRFIDFLSEIFTAVKQLPKKSSFDGVPPNLPEAPQVILIEETALAQYIKDVEIMKILLERKGIEINAKNQNPIHMYEGASVLMATNDIGAINSLQGFNRQAIDARLYIIQMTKQFEHKCFPFSERQLAYYFLDQFESLISCSNSPPEEQKIMQLRPMPSSIMKGQDLRKKVLKKRTKHNSARLEEKTRREIQFKRQATLDRQVVVENEYESDTTVLLEPQAIQDDSSRESEVEMVEIDRQQFMKEIFLIDHIEKLKKYYSTAFPAPVVSALYRQLISKREFSYESFNRKMNKGFLTRFRAIPGDPALFFQYFTENVPYNVTNGAVYDRDLSTLSSKEERKTLSVQRAELNFDFDINAHDDERDCGCKGKAICNKCWQDFIAPVVEFLDKCLREQCKFKKILWTFSGQRGVHCRVFDDEAVVLLQEHRVLLLEFIKIEAVKRGVKIKLDEPITTSPKGLLKVPLTIHPKSERLIVPFLASEVREFDLDRVPTLDEILQDRGRVTPFQMSLFEFNKILFGHPPLQFKSSNGYQYIQEALGKGSRLVTQNEEEDNESQRQGSAGDNDLKWLSKANPSSDQTRNYEREFLSLVHKEKKYGHLKHPDRLEIMYGFLRRGVPKDEAIAFFRGTMGQKRFADNGIENVIGSVFKKQLKQPSARKYSLEEILTLCSNQEGLSDTEEEQEMKGGLRAKKESQGLFE